MNKESRHHRFVTALIMLAVVTVISGMGLRRVETTALGLEAEATDIRMRMKIGQSLTEGFHIRHLEILSAGKVRHPFFLFPWSEGDDVDCDSPPAKLDEVESDYLVVEAHGPEPIQLHEIVADKGAEVSIGQLEPGRFHVEIVGHREKVALTLSPPVLIETGDGTYRLDCEFGEVDFYPTDTLRFEFELPPEEVANFFPVLQVDSLSALRDVSGNEVPLRVSAIESATYWFPSLDGERHTVAPGERLGLRDLDGVVERLSAEQDGLAFRFSGSVGGFDAGSRAVERNLMPTMLAWFRARHALSFMFGAAMFVMLFVEAALRLWR